MIKNPQKSSIEREIQKLLLAENNLEIVATQLVKKYSLERLSLEELECLSVFLIRSGCYSQLIHFLAQALEQNLSLPWAHFTKAIFLAVSNPTDDIKLALLEGAENQKALDQLSRQFELDTYEPEIIKQRFLRKEAIQREHQQKKEQWLDELMTFKSQGLIEPEEDQLAKLKKFFPDDPEIMNLFIELRERKALGILHKDSPYRSSWIPLEIYEPKDEEIEKTLQAITASMKRCLKKNPDMAEDFIIAQVMWENYEAALALIQRQKKISLSLRWLRLELLLRCRRYLDLLHQLQALEIELAHDPESTFEVLYLRAQAYWGLGQKSKAIEILESIATSRPQYRSTTLLLSEWKEELS